MLLLMLNCHTSMILVNDMYTKFPRMFLIHCLPHLFTFHLYHNADFHNSFLYVYWCDANFLRLFVSSSVHVSNLCKKCRDRILFSQNLNHLFEYVCVSCSGCKAKITK